MRTVDTRILTSILTALVAVTVLSSEAAGQSRFTISMKPNLNTQGVRSTTFVGPASGGDVCVRINGTLITVRTNAGQRVPAVTKRLLDAVKTRLPGVVDPTEELVTHNSRPAFMVVANTVLPCAHTEQDIEVVVSSGTPRPSDWQARDRFAGRHRGNRSPPVDVPVLPQLVRIGEFEFQNLPKEEQNVLITTGQEKRSYALAATARRLRISLD